MSGFRVTEPAEQLYVVTRGQDGDWDYSSAGNDANINIPPPIN